MGTGLIHLCSGDMGHRAWVSARLPGEALIWKDSPAVGPWSPDPVVRARLRVRFWGLPEGDGAVQEEGRIISALRQADTAILWFSEEPWDQVAQLWVVAQLARDRARPDIAGVLLKEGGSAVPPPVMRAAFDDRFSMTLQDIEEAIQLWDHFEHEDWTGLRNRLSQNRELPSFPFLGRALVRVLEDRTPNGPGRTERQVKDLMAAGIQDLSAMMDELARLESPYGLAWYGDAVVKNLMGLA